MPTGPSRAKFTNVRYASNKRTVRAFFQRTDEGDHQCPSCELILSTRSGRIVNHRVGAERLYAYSCPGSGYDTRINQ